MRIHIITAVFPPEPLTSARVTHDLAEELGKRGNEVTVFAPFPNRPTGKVMPGFRRSWRKVEATEHYTVVYCWHTLSERATLFSRVAENISFGISSTLQILKEPAADLVCMRTWPIFAQWINSLALYLRRIPIMCMTTDIYPETLSGMRRISHENFILRLFKKIDAQIYARCSNVTVLNSVQRDYLISSRGITPEKVHVITDWVDASGYITGPAQNSEFRKEWGISPDVFVAMYVGSLTRMAGLDLYVEAAMRLRHRKDIRVLLVGDGSMREELEGRLRREHLTNIQIIYPLLPKDVPKVQGGSDVLLMSLFPGAAEHTTPSKLIFYMFSQRPILASVEFDGPPGRIIRESECGFVIRQGDPQDLADQLVKMADDRASLQKPGENSRRYAEGHFLKEKLLPRMIELMEKTMTAKGRGGNDKNMLEAMGESRAMSRH